MGNFLIHLSKILSKNRNHKNDFSDRKLQFSPKKFTIHDPLMRFSPKAITNECFEVKIHEFNADIQKNVIVASKNLFTNASISNFETKSMDVLIKSSKSMESRQIIGDLRMDLSRDDYYNAKGSEISEHSGTKSMLDLLNEARPNVIKTSEFLLVNKSHYG